MKLKLGDILDLRNALLNLDGFPKAVGERVIHVPYKFSDEVRRAIVKNLRLLKPFQEDYDERRLQIIKEVADDGTTFVAPEDGPRQAQFAVKDRLERMSLHSVDGLHVFERSDLFVENKNPIPGSIEDALAPVIKGALPDQVPSKAVVAEGGETS